MVLFTFHFQTYGNHAMELSTFDNVISEKHWKGTFDFTEIINNFELKRGTLYQIVKIIFHISLNYTYSFQNIFTA